MLNLFLNDVKRIGIASMVAAVFVLSSSGLWADEAEKITFADHVAPIFKQHCSSCHNPSKKSAGLDVTNFTALMQGGGSGTVIEAGDAASSYLLSLVKHDESPEMPPNNKIPEPQIATIEKWIDGGALENKGSKFVGKPKVDMTLTSAPTTRPTTVAKPGRLSLQPVLRTPRPATVRAVATSPWAPIVAISSQKQVLLYNTQKLFLMGILPTNEGQSNALRFSRNGSLLMSAGGRDGAGGKVVVWDVTTGEKVTEVGDELDTILAADISPDHSLIALGGPQKVVRVYSTSDGSLQYEITKHTDWVTAIEFSPDGQSLASGDRNGGLFTWMVDTGEENQTFRGHTKAISSVSWRVDSKVVASSSEDTTVKVWNAESGKPIKSWGAHGVGATGVEFTLDGKLISNGRDKVVKLWQQDGKVLKQFRGLSDVGVAVSFCNESKRVIGTDWTGIVRVWNSVDEKHLGDLSSNPPTLEERLTRTEKRLAENRAAHAPLAQKLTATKSSLENVKANLQKAENERTATQTKINELNGLLAASKKQLESTKTQQDQWRSELTEKQKAEPILKETLVKSIEAANALPQDAELKAAATSLEQKVKTISQRVVELTQLVTQSDQKKVTTEKQVTDYTKALAAQTQVVNAFNTQVANLQKQLGNLTQAVKAETAAANLVAAKVTRSENQVKKWQAEIEFLKHLTILKTELASAGEVVAKRAAVVRTERAKLSEAETAHNAAVAEQQKAQQQKDQIRMKILQIKGLGPQPDDG